MVDLSVSTPVMKVGLAMLIMMVDSRIARSRSADVVATVVAM